MIWEVPKIWDGDEVWILGGGPSVPKQFGIPDSLVEQVRFGAPPSLYSPYFRPIHNKKVIGVNVAYMIGSWIDICFFGDDNFYNTHKFQLAEWPGLKVSCAMNTEEVAWVKYLMKDKFHPRGISSNTRMVAWNGNSGAAAINLAAHLGAKRIILLGFDMKMDNQSNPHWHTIYTRASKKHIEPPFGNHLIGFASIKEHAKKWGLEIINACPDSAIREFRKCNVSDLIDIKVEA